MGRPPYIIHRKVTENLDFYCLLRVTYSELTGLTPRDRDFLYAALRSISDNQRERGGMPNALTRVHGLSGFHRCQKKSRHCNLGNFII